MFKNYLVTAVRGLLKNKSFALINISGLAIGISASIVIYLMVNFDFSFDRFEQDRQRIYRIVSDYEISGHDFHNSGVPAAMPASVKQEVAGLEIVALFRTWTDGTKLSIPGGKRETPIVFKKQKDLVFVDEDYFKLIHYDWIAGSAATSLREPYQVVLKESNAHLYFPGMNTGSLIGREIIFNDTIRATISGIVRDLSEHTDFSFGTFISAATIKLPRLKPSDGDDWGSTSSASQLFVKLSPGVSPNQIVNQISAIFKKNYQPTEQTINVTTTHNLQALSDIHFNSNYDNFDQRQAHKPTLYGLLLVAAFLLLLACINFINLTTAQTSKRAKEIGVRKVMGSSRKQLIAQLLSETFLLTLIATLLSVALVPLLLKIFSSFIPTGFHFSLISEPGIFIFLLVLLFSVSLLSGLYPALILSAFKPALVLKSQPVTGSRQSRNARLRSILTVSQFVIAQVFIIGTLFVSKQINYALTADLGFKKDAIISFETNYNDSDLRHRFLLREKLKSIAGVRYISLSTSAPSSQAFGTRILRYADGPKMIETEAQKIFVDTNYIHLYNLHLLAGSNLRQSDTIQSFLINETLAKTLGFRDPGRAIGKYLDWGDNVKRPIAGVIADFHQQSLHQQIRPMVLLSQNDQELFFNVALQPPSAGVNTWRPTIAAIQKSFNEVYPSDDFEYHFVDESIAKYYATEQNISRLLMWATGLTIFISCLGLLGLVIYITHQRTREIRIRKVIGATVSQIIFLLTGDFVRLVFIAFIIAVPIAWIGTYKWLENFAYKTTIDAWIFLTGGLIMLLLAVAVLGLRTFKAASANPVNSLRAE